MKRFFKFIWAMILFWKPMSKVSKCAKCGKEFKFFEKFYIGADDEFYCKDCAKVM